MSAVVQSPEHGPYGRRLFPRVVDEYVRTQPSRLFASYAVSSDLSKGFQDVSFSRLAHAINAMAWWMDDQLRNSHETIAYIGTADIRYTIVFLASIKTGRPLLLLSPRNKPYQNGDMLSRTACETILHTSDFAALVHDLASRASSTTVIQVPDLDHLLSQSPPAYAYDKSFESAENDPILILHSSGSTGSPKLITLTNGSFAMSDNNRNNPLPPGRRVSNTALFDFGDAGGHFYSCFPPYHVSAEDVPEDTLALTMNQLGGIQMMVTIPIFATFATIVLGPAQAIPSGYLLSEIMQHKMLKAVYVVPSILESWAVEPNASTQAKTLDFILFGGGPLSTAVGDALEEYTTVTQVYGSLETGGIQVLVPRPGQWSYVEFNPFEEPDMQEVEDGKFELVLHQRPDLAARRALTHNLPDVKTWRTNDLFERHDTLPGLWRFASRTDDTIVMASGHKLQPLSIENIIQGHPNIAGAVVAGQGRAQPVLLIEPTESVKAVPHEIYIDSILSIVDEANQKSPSYAQISRSKIIVADGAKPFKRTPKGTIVRKLTVADYDSQIEEAYLEQITEPASNGLPNALAEVFRQNINQFVRKSVETFSSYDRPQELKDTDNFSLIGIDSLKTAELAHSLRLGLAQLIDSDKLPSLSMRLIYRYQSVEKLSEAIFNLMFNPSEVKTGVERDVQLLETAVKGYIDELPRTPVATRSPLPKDNIKLLLLGPRGTVGPHVVRAALKDPRVSNVYCLGRGEDGRERLERIFHDLGYGEDFDTSKLTFFSVDLAKPKLGLREPEWLELSENVHLMIHNAWKVDFSVPLEYFRAELIPSVMHLLHFSAQSRLHPRLVYCSSIASVQDWATFFPTKVPEAPPASYNVSSPLGYGESKHVCERVLAHASVACNIPTTILRIGQVAGPTEESGAPWSRDEWLPSLTLIAKTLCCVPNDLPKIDWIPADVVGKIIYETATQPSSSAESVAAAEDDALQIYNIVNPKLTPWTVFANALRARVGEKMRMATFEEWVRMLSRTDTSKLPESEASSMIKILPFYQELVDSLGKGAVLQPEFDTHKAVRASAAMARLEAIDESLMEVWFRQWNI